MGVSGRKYDVAVTVTQISFFTANALLGSFAAAREAQAEGVIVTSLSLAITPDGALSRTAAMIAVFDRPAAAVRAPSPAAALIMTS